MVKISLYPQMDSPDYLSKQPLNFVPNRDGICFSVLMKHTKEFKAFVVLSLWSGVSGPNGPPKMVPLTHLGYPHSNTHF